MANTQISPRQISPIDLAAASGEVSGILPVPNGGTGVGSITAGALLKGNGTGAITPATADTDYVTPTGVGTLSGKTLTTPKTSQICEANTGSGFGVLDIFGVASAVNRIGIYNAATLQAPGWYATGSDTNINFAVGGAGTGVVLARDSANVFREVANISGAQTLSSKTLSAPKIDGIYATNGTLALSIANTASAVDSLTIYPSATGVVGLSCEGGSSAIDLNLVPKGGTPAVNIFAASGSVSTLRATGSASNVGMNITTKGTGVVQFNGVDAALKVWPINAQTGTTYTLALTDGNTVITASNASAQTYTFPQDSAVAIPVGSEGEIVVIGAGQVTCAAGTGATLRSRGSVFKSAGQYAVIGWRKYAANTFVITGDLVA